VTESEIKHFLIVYNIPDGKAQVTSFGENYERALEAYSKAESKAEGNADLDIVLISADSLETIERTHSSYFETETFESLLPAGMLS